MAHPEAGTTALDSRFEEIVIIRDREFQRYAVDHNIYFGPVDDEEVDRLEHQQRVFDLVFDTRLIFPPIQEPQRILDCGYGAGAWAVEVAEQFPDCQVIGVDISPHMQPLDTPENLWLQVDDLNRSFTFPSGHFDLVHSRLVASGINRARWTSYVRDLVRVTKRGGWVQMVEISYNIQSDNGSLTDEHALRQWSDRYRRALEDLKDLRVASRLGNMLAAAGLTEVESKMIQLPLSDWPTDPRMREIGAANKKNVHSFLESLALYPMTRRLGMRDEEFDELITRARQEAEDHRLKPYLPLYVSIGKKP
ncbi:hypothetical protein VTN31DRAFT_3053 [Thermomyces dupontii]|uniref:uncharacterized protein n=1 Tax=Talaromyces thermophilus TaxID=28565 RepID=UPI003744788F